MNYMDRDILLFLNYIGMDSYSIDKLLDYFGGYEEIIYAKNEELQNINKISPHIKKIISNNFDIKKIDYILDDIQKYNIITELDKEYPNILKNIDNPPKVLYYKGRIELLEGISLAVVGARKATDYGKWACEKIIKPICDLGINIVSGLAMGIDETAHKIALKLGTGTIGVLGTGIDEIYPKKNRSLYEKMYMDACVITEFSPGTAPFAFNFPLRNRIIAGLSEAVLVVEAKLKSGSLITARYAAEQGKDVFSIPGNINSIYSEGTNLLIKDGAIPTSSYEDIINMVPTLAEALKNKRTMEKEEIEMGVTEREIYELIKVQAIHIDMISHKLNINISDLNSILTIMEIKGIISELTGGMFTIN